MTADDPRPAGEALGSTDLRAYCHQCHHAWTAHDDGTDDGDHCRVCECDGYVPDFTDEDLSGLQDDLDELERTDPDVAASAASYDRMVERITGRALPARPAASGGATDGERPATRCGNRLPVEHATLVCGRKAGHDGYHRCTRADGTMTGWADIPTPVASQADGELWEEIVEAVRAELACGTAWYIPTGESIADAVFALPAMRRLLADAAKVHADSPVRRAAAVLSDRELSDALDLWYRLRRADGQP